MNDLGKSELSVGSGPHCPWSEIWITTDRDQSQVKKDVKSLQKIHYLTRKWYKSIQKIIVNQWKIKELY